MSPQGAVGPEDDSDPLSVRTGVADISVGAAALSLGITAIAIGVFWSSAVAATDAAFRALLESDVVAGRLMSRV